MADRPVRIQRQRTRGWRMPENTVYVGRPSRWGNPWQIGETMYHQEKRVWLVCRTADDCVLAFRYSVDWDPDLPCRVGDLICMGGYGPEHRNRKTIRAELRGKNLACWCRLDQPCHADILLEIANG